MKWLIMVMLAGSLVIPRVDNQGVINYELEGFMEDVTDVMGQSIQSLVNQEDSIYEIRYDDEFSYFEIYSNGNIVGEEEREVAKKLCTIGLIWNTFNGSYQNDYVVMIYCEDEMEEVHTRDVQVL